MNLRLSDLFTQQQKEAKNQLMLNYQHTGSSAYAYEDLSIQSIKRGSLDSQSSQQNVINEFKKQVKQSLNVINTPKSNLYGHTPVIQWSQQNFFKQSLKSNNRLNTETSRGTNSYLMQSGLNKLPSQQKQRRIVDGNGNSLNQAQQILQNRKIDSANWANLKDGIDQQVLSKQHTIQAQNTQSSISLNNSKQISMKDRMKTVNNQFYKMKLVFSDSFHSQITQQKDDTSRVYPGSCTQRENRSFSKYLLKNEFNNSIDQQKQKNNFTDITDRQNTTLNGGQKFTHQMASSICMAQIKLIKGGKVKKQEKEKFQQYYDSVSERLHDIKQTRTSNNFEYGKIIDFDWKKIKYHPVNEQPNMSLKEIRDLYLREKIKNAQIQLESIISSREKQEQLKKEQENQIREDKYIDEYRKKTFFLFRNLEEEDEIQKNKEEQRQQNMIENSVDQGKLLQGLQSNEVHEKRDRLKFKRVRQQLREYLQKHYTLGISLNEAMTNSIFKRQPFNRPKSEEFFNAVKQSNIEQVMQMLEQDKYLVYSFDATLQTPLHWAAKRGFINIAVALINHNCDIDSKDQIGRTSLFYAYREGQNEMGKFLLLNQASPWSTKKNNIVEAVYSRESNDKATLKVAKLIHLMMMMAEFKQKQKIWNDTKYLFDDRLYNNQLKKKK